MNNYRPANAQDLQHAEVRRSPHSFLVFLGWIGVEVAAYAVLVLTASDESPANCSSLCFSPQGTLILLGMMFGLVAVVGQLIVGLLLTKSFDRRGLSSRAAGTAAFFITFFLAALVLALLAISQL